MIPRGPLAASAALLVPLGVVAAFVPAAAVAWPFAAGALLVVAAVDGVLGACTAVPSVERTLPRSMSLSTWTEVKIIVRNASSRRSLRVAIYDHHPESFVARHMPLSAQVGPGRYEVLGYRAQSTRRGLFHFRGPEFRIASPLGLWWRRCLVDGTQAVRVYPNFSTISKLLAYEVDSSLQLPGMRLRRRRGEGTEFHQLRDFRDGDSIRSIDWKATARRSRLIAREYQDERDQQVLLMIDAGRRMRAKESELSHFDHTLNAMLLLSYVALRRGDSVGLMIVGSDRPWLPPRKGLETVSTLLNHVYDIEPEPEEVDYVAAATELCVKQRRRSLVVLLTNVREEDSDEILAAASLLQRRHLVLVASLREAELDENVQRTVRSFNDALLYASIDRYCEARRAAHDTLRARGVYVDDCLCSELPTAITNRYLAIKRAGLL